MTDHTKPPERIWLQPLTEDYRDGWTWCWHEIGEGDAPDVEYVRAERVGEPNEYRPWEALGITELAYFKARYLEARGREARLEEALRNLESAMYSQTQQMAGLGPVACDYCDAVFERDITVEGHEGGTASMAPSPPERRGNDRNGPGRHDLHARNYRADHTDGGRQTG